MSIKNTPWILSLSAVGLFVTACSSQPEGGNKVASNDNPLLTPALFRCQADCIRPNGDTKDINWRTCAIDGRTAEQEAPAQCMQWQPDAELNTYVFCEQVRRPPICDEARPRE